MTSRVVAAHLGEAGKVRMIGLVALLFAAAQLLFAIHSDDLAKHAPQSCEFCLAAAVADDPNDLVFAVSAPPVSFEPALAPVTQRFIVARASLSANPRGPPLC